MTHHRVRYPCADCGALMPVTYVLPVCNACLDDWAEREETEEFYVFKGLGMVTILRPDGLGHPGAYGAYPTLTEAFRAAKHAAGWDA